MFKITSEKTYRDGQTIFKEGSPGEHVYVVLRGSVQIAKDIKNKKFVIEILQPGEVFGELGFFGGFKRTATAKAMGKTTLGIIDRDVLYHEFKRIPEDLKTVIGVMLYRYKKLVDRATEFTFRAEPRIQKTLSLSYHDQRALMKASLVKATSGNLSIGGLFITTDSPLKQGERFLLELHIPEGSEPLQITCVVAWTREEPDKIKGPAGMGIKFLEMIRNDRQILKKYLNKEILGS